jgi:glucose/arabinose dehydrogenase
MHARRVPTWTPVPVLLSLLLSPSVGAAQGRGATRTPACTPGQSGLQVADGFCAILVASDLRGARHLVVAPNGDVIVNLQGGRSGGGGATLLRDTDGDGKADVRESLGTPGGNGIALSGDRLYIATNDAVLAYRLAPGATSLGGGPDTIVSGLPNGGHAAKSIALGPDNALFVNIGSRTNSCQVQDRQNESPGNDPCTELETRAGIWRFDARRSGQHQQDGIRFATGLRNVVALYVNPASGQLYGMQHGRDQLFQNWASVGYDEKESAELPSEEFVELNRGDDFGWPYCYHNRFLGHLVLAPEYGGDETRVGRCADKKEPLVAFPGHWAPNGLTFYNGTQFPAEYRGGAFIAFHGSWNRAPLPQEGFKVVFQPMNGGKPAGEYRTFIDGFRELSPGGRPVGLAVGPDGSLFVGDDTGGRIWRVVRR